MSATEIEMERAAIVLVTLEAMTEAGATISMEAVGAAIELSHPGFEFDELLDGGPVADALDPRGDVEPAPVSVEHLRSEVVRLDVEVSDARNTLALATNARQAARKNAAEAIAALSNKLPRVSAAAATRAYLAASLQERMNTGKMRINGGSARPAPTPGNSALDRSRAGYGDATAHLQKQMVTGAARGAYPASQRGRRILPSDRG